MEMYDDDPAAFAEMFGDYMREFDYDSDDYGYEYEGYGSF